MQTITAADEVFQREKAFVEAFARFFQSLLLKHGSAIWKIDLDQEQTHFVGESIMSQKRGQLHQ